MNRRFWFLLVLLVAILIGCSFQSQTNRLARASAPVPKAPIQIQLIGPTLVLVSWIPNIELDVATYKIYVSEPDNGGDWHLAGFADHKMRSSPDSIGVFVTWDLPFLVKTEWVVTAIDTAGNESEPSDVAEFIRTK